MDRESPDGRGGCLHRLAGWCLEQRWSLGEDASLWTLRRTSIHHLKCPCVSTPVLRVLLDLPTSPLEGAVVCWDFSPWDFLLGCV